MVFAPSLTKPFAVQTTRRETVCLGNEEMTINQFIFDNPNTNSRRRLVIFFIAFCTNFLILVSFIASNGATLPPEPGDGPDYDNTALSLAHGEGFGYNWSSAEWRAPYLAANRDGVYDDLLERSGEFYRSAYRYPLFPTLVSTIYYFDRNFAAVRVVNALCLALSSCLLLYAARAWSSHLAVQFVFLGAVLLDPELPRYGFEFMTEALCSLLIAAVSLSLLRLAKAPSIRTNAWSGALMGLTILTRGPTLLVFIVLIPLVCYWNNSNRSRLVAIRDTAVFLLAAIVFTAPWMVRNCVVLNAFLPFGTTSAINAPVGYSDSIIANNGIWTVQEADVAVRKAIIPAQLTDPTAIESVQASEGQRHAREWIADNKELLPKLVLIKIYSLWWGDATQYQRLLFLFSVPALILFRRSAFGLVTLAICLGITSGVALMYNAPIGRILIPVHCLFHIWVALSIVLVLKKCRVIRNYNEEMI